MLLTELDAVTIDAFGTLVDLLDPAPALRQSLAERGVERDAAAVREAFRAEAAYYVSRSSTGRDEASLARLRENCVAVFLDAIEVELDPPSFVAAYLAALVFEPFPGTVAALRSLRSRGLAIAVVSNWDLSLGEELDLVGLTPLVDTVVTSAEAGADKPDPAIFHVALARLGVAPGRALHIGDSAADERGAHAAGMHFAPAPLVGALDGLA
jgi:putative hydrolase of the HAD superfamily